jgi:sigma-B regulation protein RsbU (phosphoserine phosphatase)
MQTATQKTMRGPGEDRWELTGEPDRVWTATEGDHSSTQADELFELRHEQDDLRRTVLEAAQLQRRLCGPRYLRRGSYTLAAELFPVQHVSGDLLSVLECGSRLIFALGDIAGKGLRAGMWFTHVVGLIRTSINRNEPAAAMSAINRELYSTEFAPLTSLFLASLDLQSDEITYCNAGHPPSLIMRQSGGVEPLHIGGPILGAVPEAEYAAGRIRLEAGDSLLSFSDGIMESRNPLGSEFGIERLILAAKNATYSSATDKLFSLLGTVADFVSPGPREDDFAVLWLNRDDQ